MKNCASVFHRSFMWRHNVSNDGNPGELHKTYKDLLLCTWCSKMGWNPFCGKIFLNGFCILMKYLITEDKGANRSFSLKALLELATQSHTTRTYLQPHYGNVVLGNFLPFSWTTLRGKHCRHTIAVMGVVDTFRHCPNTATLTLKYA